MSIEEIGEAQMSHRWQMNRAGILNFWFYEDEEFILEDGRLVLRGTNGAGKSVTMQSFIPLVLDGDKRPHRLDPFGSKDRKIEYYLLGDKDEHSDRTGYLWLEFYHPAKNIYKTIGIGLRARRGMAQVGFWGFVLEDGRRMNQDFWLYDRVLLLEGQGKFPLDRKALEERIGSGGQVVQEQRAYRDLVNRTLFGYHDKEAYGDLLQLLIQLRSPKLSKDVKPTAIYDILNQALPPLQEEELRPLSEVMEDMDQLADRLEELKLHKLELDKISRSYDQYNRFLLYQSGTALLETRANQEAAERQIAEVRKDLMQAQQEEEQTKIRQDETAQALLAVETELDLIGRSEAMEKQRELEQAEKLLSETEQYVTQAQNRLTLALQKQEKAEISADQARKKQNELLRTQRDTLEELDGLAGDIEFSEHYIYARYWSPHPPEELTFLSAWRNDVDKHVQAIEEAKKKAEQEREAGLLVTEYDKQLGSIRAERDQAEVQLRSEEEAAASALQHWKDRLLEWKQSLRQLRLDETAVQSMFSASSVLSFKQQDVESVLRPARQAAEQQKQEFLILKLEQEQKVQALKADLDQLAEEKKSWEQSREPEPPRTESRVGTRARYGQGQGAPLYEVCEFHPHIGPEQQASVEYALLQSGVLDAWIRPDGHIGRVQPNDEEVWIASQPLEWGYTLADVLRPLPSVESGLTEQQIEAALRSFAWGEVFDPASLAMEPTGSAIGRNFYQLGPLVGKMDGAKHQAQYIGKEAQKQFKRAEIARLQRLIDDCMEQIELLNAAIRSSESSIEDIEAELSRFPLHDMFHETLVTAWKSQYEAESRFRILLEQEQKKAEELREKQRYWSELKQQLIVAVSRWTRLKTLVDLQDALRAMGGYLEGISQLQSDWREYRQKNIEAQSLEEEAKLQAELAETEQDNRDELLLKQRELAEKAKQLRKLMDELGIGDLHARISELKRSKQQLKNDENRLIGEITGLAGRIGRLQERQTNAEEQGRESAERYYRAYRSFLTEWRLRLVPETMDQQLKEDAEREVLAECKAIVTKVEPLVSRSNREKLSGTLQDYYNASKHLLAEYVLEAEINEQGRITIVSMRDRNRPQKPSALFTEIEAMIAEQERYLSEKDRELFEEIILRSVGKSIRQRIQRAEQWLKDMNRLMAERDTSSGLKLQLQWLPKAANSESELNTDELVTLLRRDAHLLHDDEIEQLVAHFRSRVQWAKQEAVEEREALRKHIYDMLDYRSWFQFSLRYKKGDETQYRELTDARFNVLSGGEKAMSMYIPLFAATYSRYADARPDAPKIISLDEAFAGVDEENIRDLFGLLTEMDFDYMMTSQVLWGCYDTVPKLAICEIYRPKDANFVTVMRYRWNGKILEPAAPHEEEVGA